MDIGTSGPYGQAWELYWRAGWAGVLPLLPGRKGPPPSGFTGWAGVDPSRADIQAWLDDSRLGPVSNIGLHLPSGIYGLDVDNYGGKTGGAALAALVERLGPLPATWIVSSRDDGVSGIRLYRATLPSDRVWIDEPGGHGAGIESIHKGHRYAVVWPSIHPDTGRVYTWRYTAQGRPLDVGWVPAIGDLPELPAAWVEALSRPGEVRAGTQAGHDETVATVTGWREGEACERVKRAAERAMGELAAGAAGGAIHGPSEAGTWELACLGHEGHSGVRKALAEHYAGHLDARAARDGEPARREADGEWWRLVRGAVGKLVTAEYRERCDCDAWSGAGLTFTPEDLGVLHESAPLDPATASDPAPAAPEIRSRRVDLGPWLDGSYAAPTPTHGAIREDDRRLLYSGKWHNVDAPNEAGKSMLAIAHARDEMLSAKRAVVYVHFEEELPGGTIDRLLGIGLDRELIRSRFVWLSNESAWEPGDLSAELAAIDAGFNGVGLVILDGRNAACSRHGRDPSLVDTVGWFRHRFVSPAARLGAAVLSLGHPPKAKDRQDERHGYGSTAWLDEIDGVAFRLAPAKGHPIRKGASGSAGIHVVKDRYGEVSRLCVPDDRDGWRYAGSLVVDDSGINVGPLTTMRLSIPRREEDEPEPTEIDRLGVQIIEFLSSIPSGSFESRNELRDALRAKNIKFRDGDLEPALVQLAEAGKLDRDPYEGDRKRRGGRLVPLVPTDSGRFPESVC